LGLSEFTLEPEEWGNIPRGVTHLDLSNCELCGITLCYPLCDISLDDFVQKLPPNIKFLDVSETSITIDQLKKLPTTITHLELSACSNLQVEGILCESLYL
jgi:hypothetical protein